ncbi:MAG: hypothetical protein R2694_12065 [Ilumatobacteraceae bacterium]|nr:hypothetical protein [Ilumatobacter sp.]
MKRRTLDIAFSVGGALFAVLLLILGLVLSDQGDFASSYVHDELLEQKISFPAEYNGGETEVEGSGCLTEYAGTPLDSGAKAECYANYYINTHLHHSAEGAGYAGETYSSMGSIIGGLKADLTAAQESGDQAAIDEAQAAVDSANGLRDTMFKGETLRGLLLTTYGFSIFGDRADTAALVCYLAAALLFLLSVAGIAHAFTSKHAKDVVVKVAHEG